MAMQPAEPAAAPFGTLVSLPIYIELDGRIIPQNDTLYEPDPPNHF